MYDIYVVKKGDTIQSIADEYNTTLEELYNLNTFNPANNITVGQTIVVPAKKKNYYEYYTVQKGDNIYSIAKKYNTDPDIIAGINGLREGDYIYENEILLVPSDNIDIYITKEGDTLDKVINNLNENIEKIYKDNNKIYLLPDQIIISTK